ncbi:MAG TPA: sigma 54-interacting transcriptional regulator [Candidatus Limnocylindria bacterium]|nr:sigma 54-interacting transcriptional regulator [Candidatus Limnocylindria bacterium]
MASILSAAEREFFREVSDAAFANPFSPRRQELDTKIAGGILREPERVQRLLGAITPRIAKLEQAGKAHLKHFRGEEQVMMRNAFLFEMYHAHCDGLDELIVEQLKAGDAPCTVRFAREALAALSRRGFAESNALRFFSIFFQLRRAYYFIVHGLQGDSASMHELRRHLWNNVFTHDIRWYEKYLWNRLEDFSTLLLGETGTGKGAAAAAIGRAGFIPYDASRSRFVESFTRSFISLNLSQFPETLIESELFGHKRGAFTGAVEAHEGIFSRCSAHGSIFLDEIGDASVPVQIKLLQVLQDRAFSPVGSHEKLRFKGRVIAATNRSLEELRVRKLFRDDFFYRLCSDVITVPSLRQRLLECPEELHVLLASLVQRMTGETGSELIGFVRERLIVSLGEHYEWPGNVRELEQAVRRVLITGSYEPRRAAERDFADGLSRRMRDGSIDADELLSTFCGMLHERFGTFEEVARRANLDARTVKRYLAQKRAVFQ